MSKWHLRFTGPKYRTDPRFGWLFLWKSLGKEVIYDAEHFFDGFQADRDYAFVDQAAEQAGADTIVLRDTNGGNLDSKRSARALVAMAAVKVPIGISTRITTPTWALPML